MILDLIEVIKDTPEFNGDVTIGSSFLSFTLAINAQYPMIEVWGEDREHYGVALADQEHIQTTVPKQEAIKTLIEFIQRLREMSSSE